MGFSVGSFQSEPSAQPELFLLTYELVELMLNPAPNTISFSLRSRPRILRDRPQLSILESLKQSIVKLDLLHSAIEDEKMIQIVDLYSASFRNFRVDCCCNLTQITRLTIPECTNKEHA